MKIATQKEHNEYWIQAQTWVKTKGGLWSGFQSVSIIAEYIANQDNRTLYINFDESTTYKEKS